MSKNKKNKELICKYCGYEAKNEHGLKVHKGSQHKQEMNAGRKMFDGKSEKDVVAKLEAAFAYGCTDREACLYAGISPDALYRYQKKNPKFRERKKMLKDTLVLRSRETIAKAIKERDKDKNPTKRAVNSSWKYLERKKPQEFGETVTNKNINVDAKLNDEEREQVNKTLKNFGFNVDLDEDE